MQKSEPNRDCMRPSWALLTFLWLAVLSLIILAERETQAQTTKTQKDKTVVIEGTLEATPGYLRVHVQLREGTRILSGEPMKLSAIKGLQDLSDLDALLSTGNEREHSFSAFLDTGASAYVISKSTAQRFGIAAEPDAVYHETGLHGETAMAVSHPYALALSGSNGRLLDEPEAFEMIERKAVMLMNREGASNPLIELAMGEINVIGMPAIRERVIEIDPSPMTQGTGNTDIDELSDIDGLQGLDLLARFSDIGAGPAIRLHDSQYRPRGIDLEIPLHFVNYARLANPRDRGPMPDLSENFVIKGIKLEHNGRTIEGDWLLDTGAPASIISTEQARALGIFGDDGATTRQPDFWLPLGGIGGQVKPSPGFRIDRLSIPAARGRNIEYRGVYVVVHDVSTELDHGKRITLDGIFGTNLLLPTVAGLSLGLPTKVAAGPFRRIWIDGPRRRLLLELP